MTEADLKLWAEGKIHDRWMSGEIETAVLALFAERDSLASGCEAERANFARQIRAAEARLAEVERERQRLGKAYDQLLSDKQEEVRQRAAAEARKKALIEALHEIAASTSDATGLRAIARAALAAGRKTP